MRHPHSIRNYVHLPDLLSLANGLSGVTSVYLSVQGFYVWAVVAIAAGAFFDLFDGKLARSMGLASDFGIQIDSLCDLISFVIAPAVFGWQVGLQQPWFLAILALYVATGILRLARFNVTGTTDGGKFFEGMPVPVSLAVVALYFAADALSIPLQVWGILYVVHGTLMISTVKIPKL